jgi:hypothetical protein
MSNCPNTPQQLTMETLQYQLTMYSGTGRGVGVYQRPTRKPKAERFLRATLASDCGQKSNTCEQCMAWASTRVRGCSAHFAACR